MGFLKTRNNNSTLKKANPPKKPQKSGGTLEKKEPHPRRTGRWPRFGQETLPDPTGWIVAEARKRRQLNDKGKAGRVARRIESLAFCSLGFPWVFLVFWFFEFFFFGFLGSLGFSWVSMGFLQVSFLSRGSPQVSCGFPWGSCRWVSSILLSGYLCFHHYRAYLYFFLGLKQMEDTCLHFGVDFPMGQDVGELRFTGSQMETSWLDGRSCERPRTVCL